MNVGRPVQRLPTFMFEINGERTMDVDIFRETVDLIKQKYDIIINLTASGGIDSEEERLEPIIKLKPEMASYTSGVS